MGDSNDNDDDDRAISGRGATWVAPTPEEPRQQRHTMLVPNPIVALDDEDTPPPTPVPAPLSPEETIRNDFGALATARDSKPKPKVKPIYEEDTYRDPPMRIADFFPTGEEIMPLVKWTRALLGAAAYHLRRAGRFLRDRVYRPTRDVAVEKFRELTQEPSEHKHLDNYSDTFSRKRAKKWQKFEEGKKSSSYLQDDEKE